MSENNDPTFDKRKKAHAEVVSINDLPEDVQKALTQTPDTPGKDENGDGVTGGQTTADNHGDILGI